MNKRSGLSDLIGKQVRVYFSSELMNFTFEGFPAFLIVDGVDGQMINFRSIHTGESKWIHQQLIGVIEEST
ncbi:hypothetical protein ACO0K3_03755 [Undibacterium sp. Rencai35W]|uniref:hypothetical protein n=1 Tax=Undibacterium sp. Rencai35W TaxID=3413046 RepID=UPI003BEFBD9B